MSGEESNVRRDCHSSGCRSPLTHSLAEQAVETEFLGSDRGMACITHVVDKMEGPVVTSFGRTVSAWAGSPQLSPTRRDSKTLPGD